MTIALQECRIAVDLVELERRVPGVGITLTGTTLRTLDVVGSDATGDPSNATYGQLTFVLG